MAFARVREIQRQTDRMAGPRDEAMKAEIAARDLEARVQFDNGQIVSTRARIAALQAEIPELQKLRTDGAIASAETRVTRASDQLAKESRAYEAGVKPHAEAAAAAQATYDARMAPYAKALAEAEAARAAAMQPADTRIARSEDDTRADQVEIARLKDGLSWWKRFTWWLPRFLGGSSFSATKFWQGLGQA
jgi:hypothetical protein